VSPSSKTYDQLIEYLKENIEKGRGETILEIGIAGKFREEEEEEKRTKNLLIYSF
jgi:hypothetical protein